MSAARVSSRDTSSPPKILIVDDEDGLRSQLAFRFRMEGFDVLEAGGGNEARRLVGAEKPELVLTDIRMADGDGKEFINWAHTEFPDGECPVILCMSGFSDLSAKEAYGKRVSGFFTKPFDLDELVAACRHFHSEYQHKQELRISSKVADSERQIMKESAAIIAHEIANPLTIIQFSLEHMQRLERQEGGILSQPAVKMRIDRAMSSVQLIARNVLGLRILYKNHNEELVKQPVQLGPIIASVVDSVVGRPVTELDDSLIKIDVGAGCEKIQSNQEALEIILCNLLRNALQSRSEASSQQPVAVRVYSAPHNGGVCISVINDGSGISASVLPNLFKLGVTSKGSSGMGIGLAVSWQLAERLGGKLILKQAFSPTEFVLELPST